MTYDYRMARRIGTQDDWELVVDADSPLNEDGSYAGPPDVFKLEYSGWVTHIEFKPATQRNG